MLSINEQELAALIAILNRTPMTPAEALWMQALVARIAAQIKEQANRAANLD